MRTFSNGKIILCLAGIFVFGAATGAIFVTGAAKKKMEKRYETKSLEASIMELLRSRLQITAEQAGELQPLVDLACNEYRAEQGRSVERVLEIIHNSNQRVAKKLTPEQVGKLEEM
jgi:hypothetical protein